MSQVVTTPDGVEHEFPDETPDSVIKSTLANYVASKEADTHRSPTPQPTPLPDWLAALGSQTKQIPAVAGGIGALLGGPVGAGLGGALGEDLRQTVVGEPLSYGKIAGQGAIQGALGVAGEGLGWLAGKAAGPLMQAAGVPRAAVGAALSQSPAQLARAADVTDALADVQTAFGHPDAAATRELADNLLAARDASQAASTKFMPKIDPRYEMIASVFNPHRIPAVAAELAGRAALTSPALRYYAARGLASPGTQAALAQSPRAAAALWSMLTSAPADATR